MAAPSTRTQPERLRRPSDMLVTAGLAVGGLWGASIYAVIAGGDHMFPWPWSIAQATLDEIERGTFSLPRTATAAGIAIAGIVAARFVSPVLSWLRLRRQRPDMTLRGTAAWATPEDVASMGLGDRGVFVGGVIEPGKGDEQFLRYLRHDGPEHVIAFAPTRSGKGVSLVLPTLLTWPDSVVVFDIKDENWHLTSGWRAAVSGGANRVLRFAPTSTDGSSCHYNPIAEVRWGTPHDVADAQQIALMLVDPDGVKQQDHWDKTAYDLFTGAILHVGYSNEFKEKSLRAIDDLLSQPGESIEAVLRALLDYEHSPVPRADWHGKKTHPVVAKVAQDMLDKSGNERSGVLSTAKTFLTLYRDPIIGANIAYSDFRIADLQDPKQPVSLYLCVPASDKDRLKPLIRLIFTQIVRLRTETMEYRDGRAVAPARRCLLLIDEFPSLGRLNHIENQLAFMASYGLKCYLITQGLRQLEQTYGRENTILMNCHVRAAFPPNEIETARLLSEMLGKQTVLQHRVSFSHDPSKRGQNITDSFEEQARSLLEPDEVMNLPGARKAGETIVEPGRMLIFVAGHKPIYGTQSLYFQSPELLARARIAPTTSPSPAAGNAPVASSSSAPSTPAQKQPPLWIPVGARPLVQP